MLYGDIYRISEPIGVRAPGVGRVHEEGICREYFSLESKIGSHIADPQIC